MMLYLTLEWLKGDWLKLGMWDMGNNNDIAEYRNDISKVYLVWKHTRCTMLRNCDGKKIEELPDIEVVKYMFQLCLDGTCDENENTVYLSNFGGILALNFCLLNFSLGGPNNQRLRYLIVS